MADTTATTVGTTPAPSTKTPTAAELEAAILGQQPTATPPQAKYRYEVAPGQVYEGNTPEEALEKLVNAQKHAVEHIRTIESENRSLRAQQQPRDDSGKFVAQNQTATPAGFDAQKYFQLWTEDPLKAEAYKAPFTKELLVSQLGDAFGIPADQVVSTLTQSVQSSQILQDKLVADQFLVECPDFPYGDEKAIDALTTTVQNMGGNFTPQVMQAAHYMCVAKGLYQPVAQTTPAAEARPQPIPVPNGTSGETATTDWAAMAERMPAADLKKFIEDGVAKGLLK